ncbi:MAG: nucleoside kinase [Ruminococcus sp.]|nr:nucleoside kinase [Ruminococcus sp.]
MKIVHFSEINKEILSDAKDYINSCCESYDKLCEDTAIKVSETSNIRPIILLSGPSGSGKTTTALKIEACLDAMGKETHTISMDNYFLPKEQIKESEDGKIDYEAPERIDITLLQDHILKLANCEEITIPSFNFKTQSRQNGKRLKRKKGEMVIFEGIHALNPEVTGFDDLASTIYISVRTRIQLSNGELFHPEMIRLMRRMIRDKKYRNRKISETLDMFDSVQRGENLYINPYKQRAHIELDTFHGFEVCSFKNVLLEELILIKTHYNVYNQFLQIENVLKDLESVDEKLIPSDSLIREFIGGSSLKY